MPKNGGKIDHTNKLYGNAADNNEIDDLDNKDALHLNNGLTNNNNNNNIEHVGVINQQDKQQNHFGVLNNNKQPKNDHFGGMGEHDSDANDESKK